MLQRSDLVAALRPPGHSVSRPLLQLLLLVLDPVPQDVEQDVQLLHEFHAINIKNAGNNQKNCKFLKLFMLFRYNHFCVFTTPKKSPRLGSIC